MAWALVDVYLATPHPRRHRPLNLLTVYPSSPQLPLRHPVIAATLNLFSLKQ